MPLCSILLISTDGFAVKQLQELLESSPPSSSESGWLTSCELIFTLLVIQRVNSQPGCERCDEQISDWSKKIKLNNSPRDVMLSFRVLGEPTAPSYRTATPLPAAALQLSRLRSVTEDIWATITLVALCQFASVRII